MMRRLGLISLGVVVFVVTLVLTVPAPQAYRLLGDQVPAQAWGLHGSLWDGEAAVVVVDGVRIDGLQWRLDRAELRGGRIAYHVSGRLAEGEFSGHMATRTGEHIRLTDVRANLGADSLVRMVGATDYPATLGGTVDAYIREADVEGERPTWIDGVVNWDNASVSAFGESVELGSFGVRLDTGPNGELRGDLRTTQEGPLRISGDVELLLDGTMTGRASVITTERAGENLLQGMVALGIPDPEQELDIRFEGNINDPMGFQGYLE